MLDALGLFALSGLATAWLGPLLVGFTTATFVSQRAGFAVILTLLVAGIAGLSRMHGREALRKARTK